jgi:rubrerythrin
MANILQPAEIVEIGIEKEKKRRDFYALAADHFKDEAELAELFGKLRDWEEMHIKRFQEIRDTIAKAQYTEQYPGETEGYMQALVHSDLYSDITPEKFAEAVKTPAEALQKGITFEKDAILFFSGLLQFVDKRSKEIIEKLIGEEQAHMLYLFNMKKKLGK